MRNKLHLLVLLQVLGEIRGLDNGLALTPPMGWLTWQRYRCQIDCGTYPEECINEHLIQTVSDLMVSEGYLDAGYQYVIIDDCWSAMQRDANGHLQPDPVRFPNGMKAVADYVHGKGLKFGMYGDFGTQTCAGYPGSLKYLEDDAYTFALWEIDYLKFDTCNSDISQMEQGHKNMSDILMKIGRPILFSCEWPFYMEKQNVLPNYAAAAQYCNMWRNYDDIQDSWDSFIHITNWISENQDRFQGVAGPGHWNDPDMLLVGGYSLSEESMKAQMALYAVLAAPLIMSADLKNMDPRYKAILQNKDIIGINQDSLGIQGRFILSRDEIYVWGRSILPKIYGHLTFAIAFISQRSDGLPHAITVTLDELGLNCSSGYTVLDVFEPTKEFTTLDSITVRVKPSGVVFVKALPIEN